MVYNSNQNSIDSIYIKGRTNNPGARMHSIRFVQNNDSCLTLDVIVNFKGHSPFLIEGRYDTMINVGLNAYKVNVFTKYDTMSGVPIPMTPIITDTATWDNCTALGLENLYNENQLSIYPNPSKDFFKIETVGQIKITAITLNSLNAKLIKQFKTNQKLLDIRGIGKGVYFLKIETDTRPITKKVFIY